MQSVNRYLEELYGLNESEDTLIVSKYPKTIETILDIIKNSPEKTQKIEYVFPTSEYFSLPIIKKFVKYFEDKGYKIELSDTKPYIIYFDRKQAQNNLKKINESSETFGDKEYINHEFSKIKLSKDYKPQLKIMGEKSETRWISITKEQFEKIKKILEK